MDVFSLSLLSWSTSLLLSSFWCTSLSFFLNIFILSSWISSFLLPEFLHSFLMYISFLYPIYVFLLILSCTPVSLSSFLIYIFFLLILDVSLSLSLSSFSLLPWCTCVSLVTTTSPASSPLPRCLLLYIRPSTLTYAHHRRHTLAHMHGIVSPPSQPHLSCKLFYRPLYKWGSSHYVCKENK